MQRRELETNAKQNGYWTGSMQNVSLIGWDPKRIAKRRERDRPAVRREPARRVQEVLPGRPLLPCVRLVPETKATPYAAAHS